MGGFGKLWDGCWKLWEVVGGFWSFGSLWEVVGGCRRLWEVVGGAQCGHIGPLAIFVVL